MRICSIEKRPPSSPGTRSAIEEMRRRRELIRQQRDKLRQVKQEERANLLRARNPAASAAASLDVTGLTHTLLYTICTVQTVN